MPSPWCARREGRLAEPEARLKPGARDLFAALPVPAAQVGDDGRVVEVNAAWASLRQVAGAIGVGVAFPEAWMSLTGDAVLAKAVEGGGRRGRRPTEVEVTITIGEPRRLLASCGALPAAAGSGMLVTLVDLTSQYRREQRLVFEATHDQLTGVANRAWLDRALAEAMERQRRYGEPFALLYLDLDSFKPVNDRLGHAGGDFVLRAVAERWTRIVRASDLLARVGGDEFVVLVQHVADAAEVSALAGRLSEALADPFAVDGGQVVVSVTVGVAFPASGSTVADAIAQADRAMYREKRAGGPSEPSVQPPVGQVGFRFGMGGPHGDGRVNADGQEERPGEQ